MPDTKPAADAADAAALQPPRSDAPADAQSGRQSGHDAKLQDANPGSPAAPVMKQFARTEAESGGRD